MNIVWTGEMSRVVAQANSAPARVEVDGAPYVLLPADEEAWARHLVPDLPGADPVCDPRTGAQYVLYPALTYERIKPLFEEDPVSTQERKAALRTAGLRAGWNGPVWDDLEEPPGNHESR
jgi:hypothetical protein